MSHSKLLEGFDALAATSVTARNQNVQTRGPKNLMTSINPSDLPLRLLLPVDQNSEGRNIGAIDLAGRYRTAIWKVTDLFLLEYVESGAGLYDCAEDLTLYVVAYENAINANRTLIRNCMVIEDLLCRMGVFEWPMSVAKNAANPEYFGVWCSLTIKEIIQ